jgi:hypothetical protein
MIIEHTPSFSKDGYRLSVSFNKYQNGQNAIQLFDMSDGFPFATASVALTNVELESDDVAIKNYSENEGILESLIAAGIISQPHSFVPSGHVNIPICKIIKNA